VGEHEEVEGNLLVCSVGAGWPELGCLPGVSWSSGEVLAVAGGGLAREGGMGKSGSTSRSRATCLEPWFGWRRSGKRGLMARSSGSPNGAVVVVLRRV
jgi:hypothetical protein